MSTVVAQFCGRPARKDEPESMATTTTKMSTTVEPPSHWNRSVPVNSAPADFDATRDLLQGLR